MLIVVIFNYIFKALGLDGATFYFGISGIVEIN